MIITYQKQQCHIAKLEFVGGERNRCKNLHLHIFCPLIVVASFVNYDIKQTNEKHFLSSLLPS